MRLLNWLLRLGVALLILDALLIFGTECLTGDHYSHYETLIYPLLLHYYAGEYPALEIALAVLAMAIIIFSASRHPNKKFLQWSYVLLALPALALATWTCGSVLLHGGRRPFYHLDSILYQEHTYQLAAASCYEMDSVCSPTAYLVFRCDSLGLGCDLWNPPYILNVDYLDEEAVKHGVFKVNPPDNTLQIQFDSEKNPVTVSTSKFNR